MKSNRLESIKKSLEQRMQEGLDAYNAYSPGRYESLATMCVAVHLMSESLSLLPDPHRMQSYFKGERYSRFHCLIFAEQNESGKLEDCALYSKRDVVSFFRAHLQHGSDSHKDLRSESVKRKMNMLSRYSDEDTSVALVFADGLNFVETPFFAYSNEARSPNYPGNVGHPDTEYSVYTHTFKSTLGEFKVGTVESVTLAIFLDIFSALRNQTNKNSKVILGSDWYATPKWAAKFSDHDRHLISQLMKHYSKNTNQKQRA